MKLLELNEVSKTVENQTVLKNLNFSMDEGNRIAIKINSRSGEALMKILDRSMEPSTGSFSFEGESIYFDKITDGLYQKMTVSEYVKFFAKLANYQMDENLINDHFFLRDVWNTKIQHISLDYASRLKLLRMFLFTPSLIVIQNPMSDFSNEGIELYLKCLDFISSSQIALLFLSNYMENLMLVSKDIYRYNASVGIEKMDVSSDEKTVDSSVADKLDRKVFKVASKFKDKTVFFSPDEIDFIESINGVSTISVDRESFPTDLTLNDLESSLTSFGFFRCHRSYLVNLQRISELISYSKNSYTIILKTRLQDKLPLSRSKLVEMKQMLGVS